MRLVRAGLLDRESGRDATGIFCPERRSCEAKIHIPKRGPRGLLDVMRR